NDRNSRTSGSGAQFFTRGRVFGDILRRKRDTSRRKKLFRRVTGLSGRGPVDRDRAIRHHHPCLMRRPPKTWRPSLKPSATVAPAPSTDGLRCRHALSSSSDRKKLLVVQSPSIPRHRSSVRLPTQSMISPASGPGPSGVAENLKGLALWWQRERIS